MIIYVLHFQIHERAELGPIQAQWICCHFHTSWYMQWHRQVAFAKGEATRMGLDATKEQLPARWQAGQFHELQLPMRFGSHM